MQEAVQMDATYNIRQCRTHLHGALSVDTLQCGTGKIASIGGVCTHAN